MDAQQTYTECMADWGQVLPDLAVLMGTTYLVGSFENAQDAFENSGAREEHFLLQGLSHLTLDITFEKYEGYFLGTLYGNGKAFSSARALIYSTYIAQGGKPHPRAIVG